MKLKLIPTRGQMIDLNHTAVSEKTLVVLGAPVGLFASTLSSYSDAASASVSLERGDTTPVGSKEDPIGSSHSKVSRATHLHVF